MQLLNVPSAGELIRPYGRTFFDETDGVLYFNYTCGGFEVDFCGTMLAAVFSALPDRTVPPRPLMPGQQPPKREDWPLISVFLDGSDIPARTMRVRDGETVPLFFSPEAEHHRIRVVKLTENLRTALGLRGLWAEGILSRPVCAPAPVIEFVGDSITCGFGNATSDVGHEFEASEENGWMSHAAIAARMLGFESRFVSVSGISVAVRPGLPGMYGMLDLYPYADRIIQDKLAEARGLPAPEYLPYDFSAKPAQYVVLNLGTNDASQVYFAPDEEKAQTLKDFESNYLRLVQSIRSLNGPDTVIVCALGCMDYYLYDNIRDVLDRYRADTGDRRIYLLKYHKMMNMAPDAGACMHPTIHRHQKMAAQLARFIRSLG